jgi:dihydrofolate reductase
MGRKTWDSIPAKYRPLPNRTNHVISNNIGFIPEGATMHMAVINAVKAAWDAGDTLPFIIGGAQIYKLAMPYVTEMWITEIQNDHAGDVVFPAFNEGDWETTGEELSKDGALKFIVKYRKGCGIGNVK